MFEIRVRHILDEAAHQRLFEINERVKKIMVDTSKLLAAVAREKTDNDSLRALVEANTKAQKELSTQLADAIAKLAAGTDTTALDAVQADLDKATADLSLDSDATETALKANVPDTPAPTPATDGTPQPLPGTGA
jgi:predicted  nucleic acid-binding Zn-ribbon protein